MRLAGRNPDGVLLDWGVGAIRRGDLEFGSDLVASGPRDVGRLYLAAAWLFAHRDRARRRRFVDVRDRQAAGDRFDGIVAALACCRRSPLFVDSGPYRAWSSWPKAPGAGSPLLSLYCWAVHEGPRNRPQLLDQQSVATLLHLGWLEHPAVGRFTLARYRRYCELVHRWADQAEVAPELVELWLVRDWRERNTSASRSGDRHPSV